MCAVVDEGGRVFDDAFFILPCVSLGEAAAEDDLACIVGVGEDLADGGVGPVFFTGGGGVFGIESGYDLVVGFSTEEAVFDLKHNF